jgi:amylosucrase
MEVRTSAEAAGHAWDRLHESLEHRVRAGLADPAATLFIERLRRWFAELWRALGRLYGDDDDLDALVASLVDVLLEAAAARSAELRLLDARREIDPEWFLRESMVGYVCYTDRFAGDLDGVRKRLDYLDELGVTYLHLMPLLEPGPAPNDGGYAVMDYGAVDPRLGSMDQLEALTAALRRRGMSLCIDLVVNHTAAEHEWARRARQGESVYRDYYLTFADRTLPDRYEETLPEVFPDFAPGNFTWVPELERWVWTTFNTYQWDLDYANPRVFTEMVRIMCALANRGVEILRLDAVPFTWKRMGTNCQNQPEAHLLLQALRALVATVAPAVVFKAEAIVAPGDLVPYLGAHRRVVPECELAYHNQLMVMVWSAVAARDVRLPTAALGRMRQPPAGTGWVTYVRCHDDIGWAVMAEDASVVGIDAAAHRSFLTRFFSGAFPGSYARGVVFQDNPQTGDARISGTAASLAGIEEALDDDDERLLDAAVARHVLLHAVIFGWGGVPLLYMGDEIGLRNDWSFLDDAALAEDNRWVHRPWMDWDAAERRHDDGALEERLFTAFRHLAAARRRTPELEGTAAVTPVWTGNDRVFGWRRSDPSSGVLLGLANVDDHAQTVPVDLLGWAGLREPEDVLRISPDVAITDGRVRLPALTVAWFVDADTAVV